MTANLAGVSIRKPGSIAPDELRDVLFWLGLPVLGLGAFALYERASWLSLLLGTLGGLLLLGSLVRTLQHVRKRHAAPNIEIVRVSPIFEERLVEDEEGAARTMVFVKARDATLGETEMVWPSKLHPLMSTLGESERLRVGILSRGTFRYIAWAHPI